MFIKSGQYKYNLKMSRNSEHLSSAYNSNIRLRLELSECRLRVSKAIYALGNCYLNLRDAFERMKNG